MSNYRRRPAFSEVKPQAMHFAKTAQAGPGVNEKGLKVLESLAISKNSRVNTIVMRPRCLTRVIGADCTLCSDPQREVHRKRVDWQVAGAGNPHNTNYFRLRENGKPVRLHRTPISLSFFLFRLC